MTPGARIAAAISVLDQILAGAAAEQALTNWARGARYAGSGDRAAVRDHVFDALRRRRSCAWRGGAETGRGLMIGLCRLQGLDIPALFSGEGHAPPPPTAPECAGPSLDQAPRGAQLDLPDWLLSEAERSLGAELEPVAAALTQRAPVFVRVNQARLTTAAACDALRAEGILAEPHAASPSVLELTGNARRLRNSSAYRNGLVELQDASSQAVVDALPQAARVLDYCAGGGGKSLALAARGCTVFAHDADPRRMSDLPNRAQRAGTPVEVLKTDEVATAAPFDLVLCDAPCSGSGAWRRSPDAKWRLTPERLDRLVALQAQILRKAMAYVSPGGALAYVTCSLLACENQDQIAHFLATNADWACSSTRTFTPLAGGDGFFLAELRRSAHD